MTRPVLSPPATIASLPAASPPAAGVGVGDAARVLTEADCRDVMRRLAAFAAGGGATEVVLRSAWRGTVRWARNRLHASSDLGTTDVMLTRDVDGARGSVLVNDLSDAGLVAAARRAERLAHSRQAQPFGDLPAHAGLEPMPQPLPRLYSAATVGLDEATRAGLAQDLAQAAAAAGLLSAGYLEAGAYSVAQLDSYGRERYFPYTHARYSVTVRVPDGSGSGWAGMDHWDWAKLDAPKLSQVALEKCVKSKNPVRVEPGRYTAILEPQAVADFVGQLFFGLWEHPPLDRAQTEGQDGGLLPFYKQLNFAKLGKRVVDERLTLSTDPADPELGYAPFEPLGTRDTAVYHAATWIKDGVLTDLAYNRAYGISVLGRDTGLPNPGGFRLSVAGPTQTVDEMIAITKRGLLVTRFSDVSSLDAKSTLVRGYTRDGLWLVEDGKISKPVKNLVFVQSILAALNTVEQLGVPQRAFHPRTEAIWWPRHNHEPVVVPALKVRDFSFPLLTDAV